MALEAGILKSKCSLLVMVFGLYHPREEGERVRERAGQKGKEIRFLSCYQKTTAETTNTLH